MGEKIQTGKFCCNTVSLLSTVPEVAYMIHLGDIQGYRNDPNTWQLSKMIQHLADAY